jgi:predicted esterase
MGKFQWFRQLIQVSVLFCIAMLFTGAASAAPQPGPLDDSFYTVPSPLPTGDHGDLIWYREASAIIPQAPAFKSWNLLYLSTDAVGAPNAVTGTVLVPKTWFNRRVLVYAIGTHGLAPACAPSKQLDIGTDIEGGNIAAALRAGYAVLVSDYPGYTNGDYPSYIVGIAQGHACLDIVRAAKQIPRTGIPARAKTAIWGYSQGGQTAPWAGQLQPDYTPELDLVAVAAGGVPADLIEVGHNLDGKLGSAFLLETVMGLWAQYPESVPIDTLANDLGKEAIQRAREICVLDAVFEYMHQELSELVTGNPPLSQLIEEYAYQPLEDQKLGKAPIQAPLYLYHGTADEFIPLEQHLQLKETYCAMGVDTTFGVYPGDHMTTLGQAPQYVLAWLKDRFNGIPTDGTCSSDNPRPVANHVPLDEDYIINIDQWPLDGQIHLKTLDQELTLPEASTFSAETNMSKNKITGNMSIPTFTPTIWVVLPIKTKLHIEDAEPMTGEVSLDSEGQVVMNGVARTNISVLGMGFTRWTKIPVNLQTEEPVEISVQITCPITALGSGGMTFSGTASLPPMTGGLFEALFSALMSGPDAMRYTFSVAPPEPTLW